MIDSTTIRQVQDAADILEIIGEHVSLKRAGKNFVGLCPFHEEKTPSFSVSPSKGIFKCFGCGAGGGVFQFLMRKHRINFPEAVEALAQRLGIPIARSAPSPTAQRKIDLAATNQWAAGIFRKNLLHESLGRAARQYLASRGLDPQTQEQFKLGLALDGWDNLIQAARKIGQSVESLAAAGLVTARPVKGQGYYDRFRNRLMFPIADAAQRIVGFAGRTLETSQDQAGAKYLNSPETPLFNKSFCLYGLDLARASIVQKNRAVVVEGYTDCMMAHQHGLTNVVATMGTALTDEQAGLLRRFCERVVVVFDSDQAGRLAAERAVDVFLARRIQLCITAVPQGKDPCDYISESGPQAFEQLTESALDALEYKWQLTRQAQKDADTPAGQHRAVEQFLSLLARSAHFGTSDPLWRGLLLNHVAKLLSMAPAQVLAVVNQLKSRSARTHTDRPSRTSVPAQTQPALNAMDKAFRQVLEVLLNKPSYIEIVAETIGPEDFSQPDLRAIAQPVFKWCSCSDQPQLADLLAGLTDLDQTDLITSLAEQGQSKDNFQSSIAGALDYIRDCRRKQQLLHTAESLRRGESDLPDEQMNRLLEKVQAQLKAQNQRNPGIRV